MQAQAVHGLQAGEEGKVNVIKIIEDILEVKQELEKIKRNVEFQSRMLDEHVYNLLEFLKMKKIVESRKVK